MAVSRPNMVVRWRRMDGAEPSRPVGESRLALAVFAVVASVYIIFQISGDGETNWIEGVQLLSVYVILAILFFYLPEPQTGSEFPR